MTGRNKTLRIFVCLLVSMSAWAIDGPDSDSPGFSFTAGDLVLNSALEMSLTSMDCSHLVHYLYEQSGLTYIYADSRRLYEGVEAFRRVAQPRPGDLIVWQGHVGIVVDPEQHSFGSALIQHTIDHDRAHAADVVDIRQRIGLQDVEVRALAGLDCSAVILQLHH